MLVPQHRPSPVDDFFVLLTITCANEARDDPAIMTLPSDNQIWQLSRPR